MILGIWTHYKFQIEKEVESDLDARLDRLLLMIHLSYADV